MKKKRAHSMNWLMKLSPLRWFHLIRLKGEKVRCNVCSHNFSSFRTSGDHHRTNALCPGCYSLESTRVLWFYLKNEVLGQKNKQRLLCIDTDRVLSAKLMELDIPHEICKPEYFSRLERLASNEKLKGGYFDVILCSHVLEFQPNDELVFEELRRCLRPGGFVLVQTIINWEMDRAYEDPKTAEDKARLAKYYEPGVQRIYGSDFKKQLAKAGFKVEKIDYADQLGSSAKAYYQLGDGTREMIFKCKKV
jgi:SAM-dependent methyltransferase